jgi:hypothetical protein
MSGATRGTITSLPILNFKVCALKVMHDNRDVC